MAQDRPRRWRGYNNGKGPGGFSGFVGRVWLAAHSKNEGRLVGADPQIGTTNEAINKPTHSSLIRVQKMVRKDYLAMKTDRVTADLINSDLDELKIAAKKLINHAAKLGGLGFGTAFLSWLASFAAIYLLILDRTNWRTNMLTSLLVPYIFFSLPGVLFNFLRGEFGKWVAFIAIVLRLFFPRHFPDWLEMPGSLILLLVVAPQLFANTFREGIDWLLPTPGTYSGIGWVSEFFHSKPWHIQHYWYYPSVGLPGVDIGNSFHLKASSNLSGKK